MKLTSTARTLLLVALFAIAMGYLESAVVIYIRAIYYPEGFAFPMKIISQPLMITEFWREVATIIMLLGIALIAGKTALARFAYFIYAFAIWDIFYYVFLYLLIGWPQSLLTWDVLFFIPTTWIGPVVAPVINSFTMIGLALVILLVHPSKSLLKLGWFVWTLLIEGSIIIIISYTHEYFSFMLQLFSFGQIISSSNAPEQLQYATSYIPQHFPWFIFLLGESIHLLAIGLILKRARKVD